MGIFKQLDSPQTSSGNTDINYPGHSHHHRNTSSSNASTASADSYASSSSNNVRLEINSTKPNSMWIKDDIYTNVASSSCSSSCCSEDTNRDEHINLLSGEDVPDWKNVGPFKSGENIAGSHPYRRRRIFTKLAQALHKTRRKVLNWQWILCISFLLALFLWMWHLNDYDYSSGKCT